VFDSIRKVWLLLTEEEWVRQNFLNYLISGLNYPSGLIALEKEITLNDLKKRFDILVYNTSYQPWMMVECKAASVKLNENVLQQLLRYNISVPVEYMVITNGSSTIGWRKEGGELKMLQELPQFGM
ncbi:MAG: type I restriction enzyme HsdR N-terminal domain-containing protein, partial [Flavisolibacter sp.]